MPEYSQLCAGFSDGMRVSAKLGKMRNGKSEIFICCLTELFFHLLLRACVCSWFSHCLALLYTGRQNKIAGEGGGGVDMHRIPSMAVLNR